MSSSLSSPTKSIIQGISWSVIMRWSLKFIGLINVAILARLLSPEDYGIVAMATLSYGLISLFIDFGAAMMVIRADKVTDELLNSSWTARIIQGILLGLFLFLLSPVLEQFFSNDQLASIIVIYALAAAISGFENIGIVLYRKNLEYQKDFEFEVTTKLTSVCLTLVLAFWLRSYWALVWGYFSATVLRVLYSYIKHSYRPKLLFTNLMPYWKFSLSLVSINIGKYSSQNITLLVGARLLATEVLGVLNIAVNFAAIFTQEVMLPIARAMFPQYAKLVKDKEALQRTYLNVLGVLAILLFPIGFGLSAVSFELVSIILGDKWLDAVFLVSWLAIVGVLRALIWILSGNILVVTKNETVSAKCTWLQVLILAPSVIYGGVTWGVNGLVVSAAIASLIALPLIMFMLKRAIGIPFFLLLRQFVGPCLAAITMYFSIICLNWPEVNVFVLLLLKVSLGILVYTIALFLTSLLTGNSDGAERKLYRLALSKLQKTTNK